jgi:two-component system, NtrC family, response regulator GlrR
VREAVLVGESSAHREILRTLDRVAATDAEVLLTGPSGVGKELYARYLHQRSPRAVAPFVAVNCGGLNADLLENELFGHASGAFTSARDDRDGLANAADQGTLFFDEVDALPAVSQVKLLRFVQEKEFRRVGDQRLQRVDVRFVAASNADLGTAVATGAFREDLFFRLRVIPVAIPPLRERTDDIQPLVRRFADTYASQYRLKPITLAESAIRRMTDYAWPGNVRELENCIRYLTCIQLARPVEADDLPLVGPRPRAPTSLAEAKREAIAKLERERIVSALQRTNGNIAAAARGEGKARRAFFELMRKHGITAERFRREAT